MKCPNCEQERPASKRIGNISKCRCGSVLEWNGSEFILLSKPEYPKSNRSTGMRSTGMQGKAAMLIAALAAIQGANLR